MAQGEGVTGGVAGATAYGTGSANREEDDYNAYKMWEAHYDNPVANFIRRGEVT
jgi:hypothetical protein